MICKENLFLFFVFFINFFFFSSIDGKYLATGALDCSVKLWSLGRVCDNHLVFIEEYLLQGRPNVILFNPVCFNFYFKKIDKINFFHF